MFDQKNAELSASMRTALIVEDCPLLMLDLEHQLQTMGFTDIHLASDLNTALEIVARGAPLQVAILDYVLRDQSSETLAEILQKNGTPFVIHTGHTPDKILQKFPAARYLAKPSTEHDLKTTIADLLNVAGLAPHEASLSISGEYAAA
ncbi:MAG: response regulator [Hyphomicrobium sp.]